MDVFVSYLGPFFHDDLINGLIDISFPGIIEIQSCITRRIRGFKRSVMEGKWIKICIPGLVTPAAVEEQRYPMICLESRLCVGTSAPTTLSPRSTRPRVRASRNLTHPRVLHRSGRKLVILDKLRSSTYYGTG